MVEVVVIVLIVMCGLVALAIVAGLTVVPELRKQTPPDQVLADRFAKGEIGEEEYVRRLAVLHHDHVLER